MQVASQEVVLDCFRRSNRDFTRNRKLPFDRLVLLIAKLCKKTLSIELEQIFKELYKAQALYNHPKIYDNIRKLEEQK